MGLVSGRIGDLLRDAHGWLTGILLDGGREIRFTEALGPQPARILDKGSRVEIQGNQDPQDVPGADLKVESIRNLESGVLLALPAPKCKGKPGMQRATTPTSTASLALPDSETDAEGNDHRDGMSSPLPGSEASPQNGRPHESCAAELLKNESVYSIGLAYDSLQQIQAILAYLHLLKHGVPGIGQFLDEAKHTYEQALSRFTAGDFRCAKGFAEASASLSRIVQIVVTRTLRADTTLPSLVPPPPGDLLASPPTEHLEKDLAQAETLLSRIRWLLTNGTLPSEDRAQVRRLVCWSNAFYKQARRAYHDAILKDAAEFARAALAGAYSAEHICRNWYARNSLRHER